MDTFTRISAQKANEILKTGKVTIADIRDTRSFADGHIANAQNINDNNIKSFLQNADKGVPLVCYCYHGNSSQQAAMYFADQGFNEVYSVDGGWEDWKKLYD